LPEQDKRNANRSERNAVRHVQKNQWRDGQSSTARVASLMEIAHQAAVWERAAWMIPSAIHGLEALF